MKNVFKIQRGNEGLNLKIIKYTLTKIGQFRVYILKLNRLRSI